MMTKEEKQLLFKDLCERLPYGVKIHNPNPKFPDTNEYIQTLTDIHGTMLSNWITFGTDCEEINVNWNIGNKEEDVPKPYLRPMTSMTEEEHEFFDLCTFKHNDGFAIDECCGSNLMLKKFNWLNEHHFNYRLPNSLFIEAPEEIYKEQNGKVEH